MRTTSSRAVARAATHFEILESRQLRAGDAYVPNGGHDLHLKLNSNGQVVTQATTEQHPHQTLSEFKWYDSTPQTNLASLNSNIEKAWTDNYYIWPWVPGVGAIHGPKANEAGVRALARDVVAAGTDIVILDNETWHFDIRYATRDVVDKTILDMKEMISWIRDERPQLKVGIYGYMSQSDDYAANIWNDTTQDLAMSDSWWWNSLPAFADRVADWQATSDYLRPLAESVDYMFPALYTGYTDMDAWANSAKSTIEDSRRYGKPVIPFLWPYYHEAVGSALAVTEIPTADWQRELDVVREYADSAVIWSHKAVVGNEAWVAALLGQTSEVSQVPPPPARTGVPTPSAGNRPSRSVFSELPLFGSDKDEALPLSL